MFRADADMVGFIEEPRQVLVLGMMLALVFYLAGTRTETGLASKERIVENATYSLGTVVFMFLAYCAINVRDSILIRPHPMLWRVAHGICLLYVFAVAVLLVNSVDDMRAMLTYIWPDINETASPDSEGGNDLWAFHHCEINGDTLYRQVTSVWFLSHLLGWIGKMCMMRDWRVCIFQSCIFEMIELSLAFLIPDFRECWWDSVFVDAFGANLAGMLIGWLILKFIKTKENDWIGEPNKKPVAGIRDMVMPYGMTTFPYQWRAYRSFGDFMALQVVLFTAIIYEVNIFFLMNHLWLPPNSILVMVRFLVLFCVSMPGFQEWYAYLHEPQQKRLGPNSWIGLAIPPLELAVIYKYSPAGVYTTYPGMEIVLPWVGFLACMALWVLLFFFYYNIPALKHPSPALTRKLDYLFYASFVPLVALFRLWNY
jgi:phosphatidylserine synthase 2